MFKLIASLATAGLTLTHGLSENQAANILRSEVESYSADVAVGSLCHSYTVDERFLRIHRTDYLDSVAI
jgi:hypothetical protein